MKHNRIQGMVTGLSMMLAGILTAPGVLAEQAPDWTLSTADGEQVSMSDFEGRPLVLHFWATWCPYCQRVQPGLNRLYETYRDQGVAFLGISFREDEGADPAGVLRERGVGFPTVVLGDDVATSYGVRGTPTNIFVDADGMIRAVIADSDPGNPAFEATILEMLAAD